MSLNYLVLNKRKKVNNGHCEVTRHEKLERQNKMAVTPTFRSNFIIISERHMQQTQTISAVFKGDQRQLPHSPHPIFTAGRP